MKEISRVTAILKGKCPQCRQGDLFAYRLSHFTKFSKTHKVCAKCGLKYEVEPGFFYGAMYVSYALNVALSVIIGVATYVIKDDPSLWVYITNVLIGVFLFMPLTFRLARSLYIHWFSGISYDKTLVK